MYCARHFGTYFKLLGGFCHREVVEAGAQKPLVGETRGRHWFGQAGSGWLGRIDGEALLDFTR